MADAPPDGETVARAQGGDALAREQLLHDAWRRVFRYHLRLCRGDRDAAEEMTQETIFRLIRGLDGLRQPDRFVPWALRIAVNVWRDRYRARTAQELTEDVPAVVVDPAGERELRDAALRHLDGLPAIYREALTLRYLEGLDYAAMSEATGAPVGTLKSNVARGLRMIREKMS